MSIRFIITWYTWTFPLSFVGTLVLASSEIFFRRRAKQEAPPDGDEANADEPNVEKQPFRWYHIFLILFGLALVVWLLPVLAGALLGIVCVGGLVRYTYFRRAVNRLLRQRHIVFARLLSYFLAPLALCYRMARYVPLL